jgi:TPP-dependent pyruvate/acetoin dehydrogenase alpha subunit
VPEGKLRNYADGWLKDLLVHMLRVRCVDQRMLKLQRAGRIGFVGSMLGQEAAMIGTAAALEPRDWLWSGLREGGAALMRGLPLAEYVAQMYCNSNDTAKGARCATTSSTRRRTTPAGRRSSARRSSTASARPSRRSSASSTRCTRSTSATGPRARTASTPA